MGSSSSAEKQSSEMSSQVEPGDLIKVSRPGYQHWGVYVGDGDVVHLGSPPEIPTAGSGSVMSVLCDRAVVKKEKLEVVTRTHKWSIGNNLDNKYEPRPAHVIVKDALAPVGKTVEYKLTTSNCEHFANELRYGKAESRQVEIAAGIGFGVGTVAAVAVSGMRLSNRSGN